MSSNDFIKKPQEYINYYTEKLKDDLELYDLDVNYFGFIGFFMNVMGWSRFDSAQFFEDLFKEAFVATSEKDENLNLHGSIYQYEPELAVPSTATGNIIFDFEDVGTFNPDTMVRREIHLGSIENPADFYAGDLPFKIGAQYLFQQDETGVKAVITTADGSIRYVPSMSTRIEVPLVNTRQYNSRSFDLSLPQYPFNSYYHHTIELSDPALYDLDLRIREANSDIYEKYNYRFSKFLEDGDSKVVFLKKISPTVYIIEFGSGIHGRWVANSDIQGTMYYTKGSEGNITHSRRHSVASGQRTLTTYYKDTSRDPQISQLAPRHFVIDFFYSDGGRSMKSGRNLRDDVVKYIQSRDNLINDIDYHNIYSKQFPPNDFEFSLRKIGPVDNTFYLYNVFRDKEAHVVSTSNITQATINYDTIEIINLSANPVQSENGNLEPGEYVYQVAAFDAFGRSRVFHTACEIEEPYNAVEITWDGIASSGLTEGESAQYVVFGRHFNNYMYEWRTSSQSFTDYGDIEVDHGESQLELKYDENSKLTSGTYKYKIISMLEDGNYSKPYIFDEVEIDDVNNVVCLNWDVIPSTQYYIVVREKPNQSVYWIVYSTEFTDDGHNQDYFVITENGENVLVPQDSEFNTVLYRPIFGNLISPFIYKYDTFFNQYKGMFKYDNEVIEFSRFKLHDPDYRIPPIYLSLRYDYNVDITIIQLKSYQDLDTYNFQLSIDELGIRKADMSLLDNNTCIYTVSGLITKSIRIAVEEPGKFLAETDGFTHVMDISDVLSIFIFDDGSTDHICSIPVMDISVYESDPNYYMQKIYNLLIGNDIPGNRMLGDTVQYRFLETNFVSKYYTERILKANYNFDIQLPLQLEIDVYTDQYLVRKNVINVPNERFGIIEDVSKFLQDKGTGTNVSIFRSQIVDLIHSKRDYIKSVEVNFRDSAGNYLNEGIETYERYNIDRNILSTDHIWTEVPEDLNEAKKMLLYHTPVFWYWDLDNIETVIR